MPGAVTMTLCCDREGCDASISRSADYDELAVRRVQRAAEHAGWHLATEEIPLDLCGAHTPSKEPL